MSTQTYRDQATRLVSELAGLETKHAKAREEATRERAAAGRASNSISRTSSPSTIQSRSREAERHEARAVTLDKEAARIANLIASKQKARSDAERHLADAEAADRKKLAAEADRRRRDDLRHIGELEQARRATQVGASTGLFSAAAAASDPKPVSTDIKYDVCLSFAGEQRGYVQLVAQGLKEARLRVFFDEDEATNLWGKDLVEYFDRVYRLESRYCVMFISLEYAAKAWTRHERRSALARAIDEQDEYILPARFDDTELSGLRPTIGYLDLREIAPATLVEFIVEKVRPVGSQADEIRSE